MPSTGGVTGSSLLLGGAFLVTFRFMFHALYSPATAGTESSTVLSPTAKVPFATFTLIKTAPVSLPRIKKAEISFAVISVILLATVILPCVASTP